VQVVNDDWKNWRNGEEKNADRSLLLNKAKSMSSGSKKSDNSENTNLSQEIRWLQAQVSMLRGKKY
jgi:hypothetical protein